MTRIQSVRRYDVVVYDTSKVCLLFNLLFRSVLNDNSAYNWKTYINLTHFTNDPNFCINLTQEYVKK